MQNKIVQNKNPSVIECGKIFWVAIQMTYESWKSLDKNLDHLKYSRQHCHEDQNNMPLHSNDS